MRIVFCIRSLELAGAERQLVMLANGLARRGHDVSVAVMYSGGVLEEALAGVEIVHLGKKGRWDCSFLPRLIGFLRRKRPDVVHGYLGLGNVLSVLCKPFLRGAAVVWGVRASQVDLSRYDFGARLSFFVERAFSRFADRAIVNSEAGREHLLSIGYPADLVSVIPNGIDVDEYRPDHAAGEALRRSLGVGGGDILFGLVGRVDVMKGHDVFLAAASGIASRLPEARFLCVGSGRNNFETEMRELARRLPGLDGRVYWLPAQGDLRPVYGALDVLVSASRFGEGFSNVIGEAMASGVACIATDVGDSRLIVGDTGLVVPPEDAGELERAMAGMAERARAGSDAGAAARARIERKYSPERMISSTEALLKKSCGVEE